MSNTKETLLIIGFFLVYIVLPISVGIYLIIKRQKNKQKNCPGNCSNHGICDTKTGICNCDSQYTGSDCKKCNPKVCKNWDRDAWKYCGDDGCGGTCDTCGDGEKCVDDYCSRVCNPECVHGKCQDGVCMCEDGYSGKDCSESKSLSCPSDCSGNGTCDTKIGVCACKDGFKPPDCKAGCIPQKINSGACDLNDWQYTDTDGKKQPCPHGWGPNYPPECIAPYNGANGRCCTEPMKCFRNQKAGLSGTCYTPQS